VWVTSLVLRTENVGFYMWGRKQEDSSSCSFLFMSGNNRERELELKSGQNGVLDILPTAIRSLSALILCI
jgi:hypothetical protein